MQWMQWQIRLFSWYPSKLGQRCGCIILQPHRLANQSGWKESHGPAHPVHHGSPMPQDLQIAVDMPNMLRLRIRGPSKGRGTTVQIQKILPTAQCIVWASVARSNSNASCPMLTHCIQLQIGVCLCGTGSGGTNSDAIFSEEISQRLAWPRHRTLRHLTLRPLSK